MEGYIVQWYDPATKAWRNHGKYTTDQLKARGWANALFKLKVGGMAVRVRHEETIYNIKSVKEDQHG